MIYEITSRDNKTLKLVRSLHKKKGRNQSGLYFAEGTRLVDEALRFADKSVRFLLVADSYFKANSNRFEDTDKEIYITSDKLFAQCCDTENPQGIAVVLEIPENDEVLNSNYILILDGVAEPGNMGTIIRTAEAAGIDAIYLMDGCADIYNPKVVRSAMGSLFRMKFKDSNILELENLKKDGFTIVATALYNSQPIEKVKLSGKRAIVIGNEAQGVSQDVLNLADMAVRIDMCGSVESLNAAVAAGISMYMLRP